MKILSAIIIILTILIHSPAALAKHEITKDMSNLSEELFIELGEESSESQTISREPANRELTPELANDVSEIIQENIATRQDAIVFASPYSENPHTITLDFRSSQN